MNLWSRGESVQDTPEEPVVADHHAFVVAVTDGAPDLVVALRRHPRNNWPGTHVVRGVPDGAAPHASGAAWVSVRSALPSRSAAIHEVLDVAVDLGLDAVGVVGLDVVTDPEAAWLDHELGQWAAARARDPRAPTPRAIEVLGGEDVVDRLVRRVQDDKLANALRLAAARSLGPALVNTPGLSAPQRVAELVVALVLEGATAATLVVAVLEGLEAPATLARRDVRDPLPGIPWPALLSWSGPVAVAAANLFAAGGLAPGPSISDQLWRVAAYHEPGDRVSALRALTAPHPTGTLLAALAREIDATTDPELRRAAIALQASHLGDAARPGWRALAESTELDDIAMVEEVLWRHGTAEDVPDALVLAHRLLRRRLLADGVPPRGAKLLTYLARHRGRVDVDALFIEVDARWERLPADVRAHLQVRGIL